MITERTAGQVVGDLERGGYLVKARNGRRNRCVLAALPQTDGRDQPAVD